MKQFVWVAFLATSIVAQLTPEMVFRVYEINQMRSMQGSEAQRSLGCTEHPNVQFMAGSYHYPEGSIDFQHVLDNGQSVLQIPTYCLNNRKIYRLVFGHDQNYERLLKEDPVAVARSLAALSSKHEIMIDWQYPVAKRSPSEVADSAAFLKKLMGAFSDKPIVRMPASSLCYVNTRDGFEYATGLYDIRRLVLQMHGSGYNSYEDFFTRTSYPNEREHYKEACPQHPSLEKLKEAAPDKTILLSVTLKSYVRGYNSRFEEFLKKALDEGSMITQLFYDDYPPNALRL